ncbi:MAG: PVC-type heme-binding CxxCH protein [Candidatus Hydrogenedentota bacterium]
MFARSILLITYAIFSTTTHAQTTASDLVVPEGFTVEKVADSSLTAYPMFMEFDDEGNLFIAESTGKDSSGKEMAETPECQILKLEDTNQDGIFDKRTVFAEKLSLPMGILWHRGSLFVASPPEFLRFDDTDGDGVSDHREALHTGWNVFNTASLHGPFLGPDGRLYLTHGRHGYDITNQEGEHFEGLASRIWRCWPDGSELERFAGGGFDNPVELVFTDAGEMIGTMTYFTDPKHGKRDALLHFVKGGVYPKPHESIKEFVHTGPDLMPVMTEFSRIAPSGLLRYKGNSFGDAYADDLFSAQFNPHRVQRHKLIRDGATFRTEDEDFLTSTNPDFFPTDVLEDADGSLLVSDTGAWYVDACPISRVARPNIKGAIYRIRKTDVPKIDDPWGNKIDWDSASIQQLIQYLADSRIRVQDRAVQRLIAQGKNTIPLLAGTLKNNPNANTRLQALTALRQVVGKGRIQAIIDALQDDALEVRLQTIQALADIQDPEAFKYFNDFLIHGSPAEQREIVTTWAQHPTQLVRGATRPLIDQFEHPLDRLVEHAIIYALIEWKNTKVLYERLTSSNAGENVRRAALIALDQIDGADLNAAHAIPALSSTNPEIRRTGLWVASHHPDWAGEVLAHIEKGLRESTFAPSNGTAQVLHAYINTPECRTLIGDLLNDNESSPKLSEFLLDTIGNTSLDRLPNRWSTGIGKNLNSNDDTLRWRALDLIRERGLDNFDTTLDTIIADNSEPDLFRLTAIAARAPRLEAYTDAQFAYILKQLTRNDAPSLRQSAARLLSATDLGKTRKHNLASDYLPNADALITTSILNLFQGESDEELGTTLIAGLQANDSFADFVNAGQLQAAFEKFPTNIQEKTVALHAQLEQGDAALIERFTRLEPALGTGDVGRGRRIFFGEMAACSTCHAIGEDGGTLGPDMTTIGEVRSGHDLLEAVMFPNSSFVPDFTPYQIETGDDVFLGIIGRESSEGITLRTGVDEQRFIPRAAITSMTASTVSVMPEGLDSGLSDQELLDLITFLQTLDGNGFLEPAKH